MYMMYMDVDDDDPFSKFCVISVFRYILYTTLAHKVFQLIKGESGLFKLLDLFLFCLCFCGLYHNVFKISFLNFNELQL